MTFAKRNKRRRREKENILFSTHRRYKINLLHFGLPSGYLSTYCNPTAEKAAVTPTAAVAIAARIAQFPALPTTTNKAGFTFPLPTQSLLFHNYGAFAPLIVNKIHIDGTSF